MNKQKFIRSKQKFTLIEIMFVVTILVILIGIGLTAASRVMRASANTQINAELKMIQSAIDVYKSNKGVYPDKDNIVNEIRDLKVISITGAQFIDPYDEEYKYLIDDNDFMKVYSQSQD